MRAGTTTDMKPEWSCEHYGDYEHDWLDCPECIAGYEAWLEVASQHLDN